MLANPGPSGLRRLIEGQDIRAIEGTVVPQEPQRCWAIAERKAQNVYEVNDRDVVIGLVRPERRNIGMVLGIGSDAVATPDGVAIVRSRPEKATEYPQAWLLAALRSEACRLQFWTESGGTSYGKLTLDQIEDALLPDPGQEERHATADLVDKWAAGIEGALVALGSIGDEADRKPILNSPLIGLVDDATVVGLNETD